MQDHEPGITAVLSVARNVCSTVPTALCALSLSASLESSAARSLFESGACLRRRCLVLRLLFICSYTTLALALFIRGDGGCRTDPLQSWAVLPSFQ